MVYYRKYRPQTIDELDSTSVRHILHSAFSKPESIPHAFLFTGPKGLGKTSTARIVAKVVNCERVSSVSKVSKAKKALDIPDTSRIEPCNQCDQCVSITNGTNLDVFEIDAASNRGIDEVRDLREKIRLAPIAAKKKVYIIDEVHMMTTEAFNALLKTLEEPPDHALFILCTTELHKVPATIVSRCFHVTFTKATDEEIVRSLKRIVAVEKFGIDKEVLSLIAKRADGGFRDATKILEELVLMANGEQITKDLFEKIHRTEGLSMSSVRLISSILPPNKKQDNIRSGLEFIKKMVDDSIDIKLFIQMVIADIHTLLLVKAGVEKNHPYEEYAKLYDISDIKQLSILLDRAYQEMKYAVLPQLPLELALIDWCMEKKTEKDEIPPTPFIKADKGDVERSEEGLKNAQMPQLQKGAASINDLRRQVGAMTKIQALYGSAKQNPPEAEKPTVNSETIDLMKTDAGVITKEWQDFLWKSIIAEMKQYNHTVAGVLRGCKLNLYDKKQMIIETTYKFHKERLDDPRSKDALVKICKLLTGNDVTITIELRK